MAKLLAKELAKELLIEGDWKEAQAAHQGFPDIRRTLSFDKAGQWNDAVSNEELKEAFLEVLEANKISFRPKNPLDAKRIPLYSINEPKGKYVIDTSAEYADYLAGCALSARI